MTKFIQIDFHNRNIRAFDCFHDIEEAVRYARRNLDLRHNITLYDPLVTDDHRIYLKIDIPYSFNFSVRNLRGIAAYLLKRYPERYKKYLYGTRLLVYYDFTPEIPNDETLKPLTSIERSDLTICIIRLFDKVDEESLRKVKRIKDILEENV